MNYERERKLFEALWPMPSSVEWHEGVYIKLVTASQTKADEALEYCMRWDVWCERAKVLPALTATMYALDKRNPFAHVLMHDGFTSGFNKALDLVRHLNNVGDAS